MLSRDLREHLGYNITDLPWRLFEMTSSSTLAKAQVLSARVLVLLMAMIFEFLETPLYRPTTFDPAHEEYPGGTESSVKFCNAPGAKYHPSLSLKEKSYTHPD